MIVEPVPTTARSRRSRALALAGLAGPVVLLAGVVGAGVLGEGPSATEPGTRAPTASQAAGVAPPPSAGVGERPVATSPLAARLPQVSLPPEVESLAVRSVREVLLDPPEDGSLVAIGGVLTLNAVGRECRGPAEDRWGTFCERSTILADVPWWANGSPGMSGIGPYLRPVAPPGVRLPRQVVGDRLGQGGGASVVVLARFARGQGCERSFCSVPVLERVAWVEGYRWRAPAVDPAAGRNPFDETWWRRRLAAEEALGLTARAGSPVMLVTAYVTTGTLEAVDSGAAAQVRALASGRTAALWYVRAHLPGGAGEGIVRGDEAAWVVVDDRTGDVVARGLTAPAGRSGS